MRHRGAGELITRRAMSGSSSAIASAPTVSPPLQTWFQL
jgi:hypothetical protein